jgi:hypothetical protein
MAMVDRTNSAALAQDLTAAVLGSLPEDEPDIQQMLLDVWVGYDTERHRSSVRLDMVCPPPGNRLHRLVTFDELDIHRATSEQLEKVRQDVVAAAAEMVAEIKQDASDA